MDPTPLILGTHKTRHLAQSAQPDAPVVPVAQPAPSRAPRTFGLTSSVAALLRAMADRLDGASAVQARSLSGGTFGRTGQ
jgi:hypothetical protein